MELELPNYQFLRGDSHSEETADRVREIVGHIPVGLLFIDGDHAYEGVKRDWELYSPLVKPGGWIAFHDIVDGPRTGGGVTRLFRELQTQYVGRSFILAEGSDWGGIGAVTIP
jgi:cephalosporin hydroxylase